MEWEVLAAISATAGLLVTVIITTFPHLQKARRRKVIIAIRDIKRRAIELQNANLRTLSAPELEAFKSTVTAVKSDLLHEIGKISRTRALQYEDFGLIRAPFPIRNREHLVYMGVTVRCCEIADEIISKYS